MTMVSDEIQDLSDAELYEQYQTAKEEEGPVLLIDGLQLEIAQRWEAEFEERERDD